MSVAISLPPFSSIPHGVHTVLLPLSLGGVINHKSQAIDFHDHKVEPVSSHYVTKACVIKEAKHDIRHVSDQSVGQNDFWTLFIEISNLLGTCPNLSKT